MTSSRNSARSIYAFCPAGGAKRGRALPPTPRERPPRLLAVGNSLRTTWGTPRLACQHDSTRSSCRFNGDSGRMLVSPICHRTRAGPMGLHPAGLRAAGGLRLGPALSPLTSQLAAPPEACHVPPCSLKPAGRWRRAYRRPSSSLRDPTVTTCALSYTLSAHPRLACLVGFVPDPDLGLPGRFTTKP